MRARWGLAPGDDIDASLVVVRDLGGGSRYDVYEAWDRGLLARVVAKVLRPDRLEDAGARARFEEEARIAGGLAHPNLARLLRWHGDGERPYLVFELVVARTVEDHLEAIGAVGIPETILLAIHMLSALHYVHARGVLHLDVKPANVTMGDPPRLLDLSLARTGASFAPDRPIGTRAYMAPEQCRERELTPATDLFGLGATLYEALTAMQPFSTGDAAASRLEARYPQLVEEPAPLESLLPAVPRVLAAFVAACLAADPARRPRSSAASAETLLGVLDEIGLGTLRPWPRTPRLTDG